MWIEICKIVTPLLMYYSRIGVERRTHPAQDGTASASMGDRRSRERVKRGACGDKPRARNRVRRRPSPVSIFLFLLFPVSSPSRPAPSLQLPASFVTLSRLYSHSLCPHTTLRSPPHRSYTMRRAGSTRATSPPTLAYQTTAQTLTSPSFETLPSKNTSISTLASSLRTISTSLPAISPPT